MLPGFFHVRRNGHGVFRKLRTGVVLFVAFGAGCTQYGKIEDVPLEEPDAGVEPKAPTPTHSESEELATWCDAARVLSARCARCHQDPPRYGAPFALLDYADTQEPAATASNPDRTRFDLMLLALESGSMPPVNLSIEPRVEPLSCEERATLLSWLGAGAQRPATDPDCNTTTGRLQECTESDP